MVKVLIMKYSLKMVRRNLIETSVKTCFLFIFSVYLYMATPGLGQLIHQLPTYAKKNVRLFEKCCLKLTRERCSVLYNDTCLKKNI